MAFGLLAILIGGCGEQPAEEQPPPEVDVPAIEVVSGRYQVGRPGDVLAPIRVRVLDAEGQPMAGATVSFRVRAEPPERFGMTGGEAGLSVESAVTGADGAAATVPTLGARTGRVVVESQLVGDRAWPVLVPLWVYPPTVGSRRPLCVLSFNDFHAHLEPWGPQWDPQGGLARLASAILEIRAANAAAAIPTVVLNEGDDFENTLFQDEPGSFEALLLTWDRIGVDVYQVGNHDFHFGLPFLADKILFVRDQFADHGKGHPLRITWGNVDPSTLLPHVSDYADLFETAFEDPNDERLFQQTTVLDASGVRVGVIGVVTDAGVYTQVVGDPQFFRVLNAQSPDVQGMTFYNPDPRDSTYIGAAIDDLDSQDIDVIIVASHAGLGLGDRVNIPPGKDEHIAREGIGPVSGRAVDVILSGHSHVRLNHALFLDNPAGGRTGVLQGLEGGAFVARADLMVDTAGDTVQWVDSGLVQIDSSLPEDPPTAAVVETLRTGVDLRFPSRRASLGWSDTFLGSAERTRCAMGKLINAAFLHTVTPLQGAGQVFIPMVVPSTYRTHIHPGPIDLELAYQVLSMHKMDAVGSNDDTLAYVTFRPGRYDLSFFWLPQTVKEDLTVAEYAVELVHSLQDVLGDIMPSASGELSLDVVQLGRVSYLLDSTAPAFSRVVPGTVLVDGAPPDAEVEYRLVGAHSIITTLARTLEGFIIAEDAVTGEDVDSVVVRDPDTGEPFTDTGIPLYESLTGFLSDTVGPEAALPEELTIVTGDSFRTIQPDLTVNPPDISFRPRYPLPGDSVTVTVVVRNLGETPVESALVGLYWETTPWDRVDDPDDFSGLEGLPAGHLGSLELIDEQQLGVGAYPATVQVRFQWTVPEDLVPGYYSVGVRIANVECGELDPNTGAPFAEHTTANNAGRQRARLLRVW
ncbi:MAG: hypothetical protein ABI333_09880 [bacterium]